MDGFSLSGVSISGGGRQVALSGQVADSSLVVRFVSNLELGQSSMRDLSFSTNISRSDAAETTFPFQLRSTSE